MMYWKAYILFWAEVAFRYFFVAGIAFLLFYIFFRGQQRFRKIQERRPAMADYFREIIYSTITICIFAAVPVVMLKVPAITRLTQFYKHIDDHGWLYFFA